jgi:hypothetical protein
MIVVPLMVGCGTTSSASKSDGPTKKQYVQRVNQFCKHLVRRVSRLDKPKTRAEAIRYLKEARSYFERGIGHLRRLQKPAGPAGDKVKAWLERFGRDYVRLALPRFREIEHGIRYGDPTEVQEAAKQLRRFKHIPSGRLARQLGAPKCG